MILIQLIDFKKIFKAADSLCASRTSHFFQISIRKYTYRESWASFEEVEQAVKLACAEEFIEDLPQGYDTLLGERGLLISVGQKQRIAIARAILRDSPILLLDEATSSLDAISEDAIKTAIDNISGNKTIIVIAHRLSTVRNADRILFLEKGKIVNEGSHNELIKNNKKYKKLADLQFL